MPKRQQIVKYFPEGSADSSFASFVADVLELAGLFRRAANDIAAEHGQTQPRWYALSAFSEHPMTVSQAARRLGTSRQAVQRSVNELLVLGLLVADENPDHRTAPLIGLTDQGQRTLVRISRVAASSRRRWLSDREVDDLASAHVEVKRLLDTLREAI